MYGWLNPSARNTATSRNRSRTIIDIALAAIRKIVSAITADTAETMPRMSPTVDIRPETASLSVIDAVSKSEL